jgi:hypothetical protein
MSFCIVFEIFFLNLHPVSSQDNVYNASKINSDALMVMDVEILQLTFKEQFHVFDAVNGHAHFSNFPFAKGWSPSYPLI